LFCPRNPVKNRHQGIAGSIRAGLREILESDDCLIVQDEHRGVLIDLTSPLDTENIKSPGNVPIAIRELGLDVLIPAKRCRERGVWQQR